MDLQPVGMGKLICFYANFLLLDIRCQAHLDSYGAHRLIDAFVLLKYSGTSIQFGQGPVNRIVRGDQEDHEAIFDAGIEQEDIQRVETAQAYHPRERGSFASCSDNFCPIIDAMFDVDY
jgi:hypothetical protein